MLKSSVCGELWVVGYVMWARMPSCISPAAIPPMAMAAWVDPVFLSPMNQWFVFFFGDYDKLVPVSYVGFFITAPYLQVWMISL